MKKLLLLFLFQLSSLLVFSQASGNCDYKLQGTILDIETKEALPFVVVSVKGTKHYTLTDNEGKFQLTGLCEITNCLEITCNGYCNTTCDATCSVHKEHKNNSVIYLKPDVVALNEVTVTDIEEKTGTVSIAQDLVDRQSLALNPTQTLASAITNIDGVTFTSTGNNVQLPVIHGLYGNRVLVLNNGLKHGFQNWGSDHAPEIDITSANSVTVIKGASGVRYGPEALGGAIVVDANPLNFNRPLHIGAGTGYQTNGKGYNFNTEISEGFDNLSYHVGGSYTRIGDRHAPDYSLTNTGKEEKSFNAGLKYKFGNFDVKGYYSFIDQNLALLRASVAETGDSFIKAINSDVPLIVRPFSYDINEPNQLTQHHLLKGEVNWWISDDEKLTFRVGRQINKRKEFDVRRNADLPIIDLDLTTSDYQLEWDHKNWLQLDGIIGAQLFTQDNNNNPGTNTTAFIPNYNTTRVSGFIIESFQRNQNTFEIGIRADYENNNVRGRDIYQNVFRDEYSFVNVTSSLGYIRQINDNTTFRTNLGTAWRTPNVEELYSFGQHGFKITYGMLRYGFDENGSINTDEVKPLAESNVKPEKGYKWINELKHQSGDNTYTVTAYSHYIQNYVFERPFGVLGTIRGPMPGFIFDQANAVFIGSDFTWQRQWSNSLTGTFGISYLWSQNIEDNEPLINQPPITTHYELNCNLKPFWIVESSHLSLRPSFTFKQFQAPRTVPPEDIIDGTVEITPTSEIFDFKDAPEGYFLFDISYGFKIKDFTANIAVHNVFNTRYRNYLNSMRYFADEMGRNFLFSINYNFNAK
ncbi:TonB-dependent receptor [Flammeovirga agarivorans]|uniref:TonB-dependent receptor n=1 Tax=Flammeovirga agarivorans TaxID=2726742 RepID=A0A7X8SQN0_9BACT|nr:TonB-dependent receptor [Flammeovirga agarivorans]NLR94462.1 TonB-dependent receptor [Flammeovirga agarivorans]